MVAYYSCTLSQPECCYCVTRKELLAVVQPERCYCVTCKELLKAEPSECQGRWEQTSHNCLPLVVTLSLSTGTRSPEELRCAQLNDTDIKPVLIWKESRVEKPDWEQIAPYSHTTKIYIGQWESLTIINGVLYRLWETPAGDATLKQLVLPKALRPKVYFNSCTTFPPLDTWVWPRP